LTAIINSTATQVPTLKGLNRPQDAAVSAFIEPFSGFQKELEIGGFPA
jgi:hypothetical protein